MENSNHKPKKKTKSRNSSSRKTNSSSRYLDEFHPLTARHPILSSLFKNEEQITSSLAALDAATLATSSKFGQDASPSRTLCLVLGDGRTPRTAVLAALQYGWSVVAIEEKLDVKWCEGEKKPRPLQLQDCRFMGYKGNMSQFLSEGLDAVEFRLCPISEITQLVIVCVEKGGGYDSLKSLRGRLGVSDLRVLYNNVSATIVSISSEENSDDCPLKQKPSHSFVDDDIVSNNRLVQVWNVKGTRRLSNMESNDTMPRGASSRRANSKVSQLQRQQDLARQNKMKSQKKLTDADDDDDDDASESEGSYEEKKQRNKRKSKSKRKSKRTSNISNELVPVNNPPKDTPVTVSSFLSKQKSLQREQETYWSNTIDNKMLLTSGNEEDGYENNHSPVSSKSPIIDTVPSDHPSSSIIQTHRTCTVCHRTLSRSQFSERDRYLVHLSLGPGAVCRTCSMTVAATKLKMMPSHGQLLNDYANRGEYLMNNGQLPALGYAPANRAAAEGALVLHDGINSAPANVTGNELVPFEPGANNSNTGNPFMAPPPLFPTMSVDVNAPFSGILPEEERPTHIADCKYIDAVLSMPCYPKLNSMELFASSKDVSVSMAALDAVKLYGTMDAEYFVAHDGEGKKVIPRSMKKKNASGNDAPTAINPKSIMCLVIGEGSLPRTAVLAALHYGWTTLSIDPTLDEDWDGYQDDVPNYTGYSGTISEFMSDEYTESLFEMDNSQSSVKHLVIIGVQMTKDEMRLKGHSNINEIRARYDDIPTTLVSMSPLRKATLAPKRRDGQCGSKLEKDVGYEPNCSYIDEGVFSVCRLVEVWNFHNEENEEEDEESIEDDSEYSKESIGDRQDRYRDQEYEKKFSIERLSLDEYGDDYELMHNRLEENKRRADNNRKQYNEQRGHFHRNNTIDDSVMSGSTLSTKGTMPRYDPNKKPSSKIDESNGALALPIASRLERENTNRKSRQKKDRRRKKKSSSGPRPIPDDIPEDLEIYSSNFVGGAPPQPEHQEPVDWSSDPEQTLEDDYYGTGAIERRDSSREGQGFKSGDNSIEDHHLSDVWNGAVAKYDEQSSHSGRGHHENQCSSQNLPSEHEEFDDQSDHDRNVSDNGDDEKNSIEEGSYSSSSGYHGKEERVKHDLDNELDHDNANSNDQRKDEDSDHSSNEFDDLRNKAEYYGYDDDQSSNYVDRDEADHTSTNSGIACLNDYTASQNRVDREEDDDEFHCWSDDEELRQTQSTSPGRSRSQKTKPWHRKEGTENSFASCDSYD